MGVLDRVFRRRAAEIQTTTPVVTALQEVRTAAVTEAVRSYTDRRSRRAAEDGWIRVEAGSGLSGVVPRDIHAMRRAARILVQESPHAAKAIAARVEYAVGYGIRPVSSSGSKLVDKQRNAAWRSWGETTECDFEGRNTAYGLQHQADEMMERDGEALVRVRYVAVSATLPLRLQVLSCDQLDATRDRNLGDGGAVIGGIEFDAEGRRTAYHLIKGGVGGSFKRESVRVPADEIFHVFRPKVPGQARGVTLLGSVIQTLRDHAGGQEAWLLANRISACFQGAIELSGDGTPSPFAAGSPAYDGIENGMPISPGTWITLAPGQKPHALTPPSVNGQEAFQKLALLAVSAGTGVPYHILTGDVSQANYSSLRAAMLDFGRTLEGDQWRVLIPQLCDPIWTVFCRIGVVAGLWRPAPFVATWHPPKLPMVDPTKDIAAAVAAVRSGLMTPQQAIAEMGYDPETQLEEIAAWNALLDEKKLVLDSDPRKVSQQGQLQKPTTAKTGDLQGDEGGSSS